MYEHKLFTHCRLLKPGYYQIDNEPFTIKVIKPDTGAIELNVVSCGHEGILHPGHELGPENHAETILYDCSTKIASYCRMIDHVRTIIDIKNTALTLTGSIRSPPPYPEKLVNILNATYDSLQLAKPCKTPGLLLSRDALFDD